MTCSLSLGSRFIDLTVDLYSNDSSGSTPTGHNDFRGVDDVDDGEEYVLSGLELGVGSFSFCCCCKGTFDTTFFLGAATFVVVDGSLLLRVSTTIGD